MRSRCSARRRLSRGSVGSVTAAWYHLPPGCDPTRLPLIPASEVAEPDAKERTRRRHGGRQPRGANRSITLPSGSFTSCRHVRHVLYPCRLAVAIMHDLPPEELRFHWKSGRLCL